MQNEISNQSYEKAPSEYLHGITPCKKRQDVKVAANGNKKKINCQKLIEVKSRRIECRTTDIECVLVECLETY